MIIAQKQSAGITPAGCFRIIKHILKDIVTADITGRLRIGNDLSALGDLRPFVNNELDLNDPTWKIYTEDTPALPQYIGPDAKINKAFITQGCIVEGEVTNSVLFTGSTVGEGAKIIDSVLMPGVEVEAGAVVQRALVADGVKIGKDAVVGSADSEHIELVSKRVKGVE